jgi:hypothetical protein
VLLVQLLEVLLTAGQVVYLVGIQTPLEVAQRLNQQAVAVALVTEELTAGMVLVVVLEVAQVLSMAAQQVQAAQELLGRVTQVGMAVQTLGLIQQPVEAVKEGQAGMRLEPWREMGVLALNGRLVLGSITQAVVAVEQFPRELLVAAVLVVVVLVA